MKINNKTKFIIKNNNFNKKIKINKRRRKKKMR